jgi:hypothetical protein
VAETLSRMPHLERRGGPGGDNCRGGCLYPGSAQETGAWVLTLRVGEGSSFAGVVGEVRVGCGKPQAPDASLARGLAITGTMTVVDASDCQRLLTHRLPATNRRRGAFSTSIRASGLQSVYARPRGRLHTRERSIHGIGRDRNGPHANHADNLFADQSTRCVGNDPHQPLDNILAGR